MRARRPRGIGAVAAVLCVAALAASACSGSSTPDADDVPATRLTGTLDDGADWVLQTPDEWNGTLLVFSHGHVPTTAKNTLALGPDGVTATSLLSDGFALAATSYATTGWVVREAIADQLEITELFADRVAEPEHTIAWGSSMGGLITAALVEQHPDRFDGGLSMCGVLAGSVASWDRALDLSFVVQQLLTPALATQIVGITTDQAPVEAERVELLTSAAKSTAGQARIALAGALAGLPLPAGARSTVREATNLATATNSTDTGRADVERRFGGNPSTNEGVDYARLLAGSTRRDEVEAKYQVAGLDLRADLATLAAAPRIAADPGARRRLADAVTPTGELTTPMLTIHTTGDAAATPAQERWYADRVEAAGKRDLLRQLAVERDGHCSFLPEELVTAVDLVQDRVVDGSWPPTDAVTLDRTAGALRLQIAARPAFVEPDFPTDPGLAASSRTSQ